MIQFDITKLTLSDVNCSQLTYFIEDSVESYVEVGFADGEFQGSIHYIEYDTDYGYEEILNVVLFSKIEELARYDYKRIFN